MTAMRWHYQVVLSSAPDNIRAVSAIDYHAVSAIDYDNTRCISH